MKTPGSKRLKCESGGEWSSGIGGITPPQSRVQLLPKNINKPFIKRLLEWLK
jgi:hypothetical protein